MDQMTVGTVFGLGFLILVTVVVSVVIWQAGATLRSRAALFREQEYRRLAEKAVGAQEASEQQMTELNGRMADMQARLASLEQILKQVE